MYVYIIWFINLFYDFLNFFYRSLRSYGGKVRNYEVKCWNVRKESLGGFYKDNGFEWIWITRFISL